ncbi:MAG: hypothetical protein ACUVRZ_07265 [Desulfobacca sp.]|uniref:hypothetical protein n=1 Tax=Desulfobacca sp. TaxID=2067990 RepID=UPI00404A6B0F
MNKKKLTTGIVLLVTFLIVLVAIFIPWFGNGRNGLEFSDDFFNSLAKGSSNFMADMRQQATPFKGQALQVELTLRDADTAKRAEILFAKAGATVEAAGPTLKIQGDLGRLMFAAIDDSDAMFNNQGDKVQARYELDPKKALRTWWTVFKELDTALKLQQKFREAKTVNEISFRAIEPGYNFYGISPQLVRDNIPLLTFLLVFYVIYTLWYGYGVFELFEGLGLGAEKGHKEEV